MPPIPSTWLFLPGLDGTGKLFEPILACVPVGVTPVVVRYPTDRSSDAHELVKLIEAAFPPEDFILVAESFSGPLALRVAGAQPPGLRALVLCATFAESPIPRAVASLLALGVRAGHPSLPMPEWLLRRCLFGDGSTELLDRFRETWRAVSAKALASRFKVLAEHGGGGAPPALHLPALYIRATRDRMVGARGLGQLRKRLPRLLVAEIDAPHLALQCQPKPAVKLIVEFLASAVK